MEVISHLFQYLGVAQIAFAKNDNCLWANSQLHFGFFLFEVQGLVLFF